MFGTFGDPLSLLLHVTPHEGRSVEQLLGPRRLGEDGPSLGGAVVQASYVQRDPPLLLRLADGHIPWVIEPQSVRFASARYLGVESIARLPYAPPTALPRLVNRVTGEAGLPTIDFDYLDRWRGVLARIASLVAVREP